MTQYQAPLAASLVAKWFIRRANEAHATDLDNLKLQKLLFLSHSRYVHTVGRPLIRERVEAWKHGPVIDVVYQEYKSFGNSCIDQSLTADGPWQHLPEDVTDALDNVWDSFGVLSGWALRELTHDLGPWQRHYDGSRLHVVIPNEEIGGAWPMFSTHAANRGAEAAALRRLQELRMKAAALPTSPLRVNAGGLLEDYESLAHLRKEATSLLS
ncbi:Panacea domain-containing protein [Microbacterium maritypicum]|uniref:Panacea domain-containing protein n=1 Tax=Microbacterium maritypicum TaxID=33918 RepID=UPI0037F5E123